MMELENNTMKITLEENDIGLIKVHTSIKQNTSNVTIGDLWFDGNGLTISQRAKVGNNILNRLTEMLHNISILKSQFVKGDGK